MKTPVVPVKMFKRKLTCSLVAACLAFSAVAQASNDQCSAPGEDLPGVPAVGHIDFSEISGTQELSGDLLFVDVGSDEFLLSQSEWYSIQSYIYNALALPITEASMKSKLKFQDNTPFTSDYQGLMEEYIDINASAMNWNTNLYPSIVDLALDLSNYSNIHMYMLNPLISNLNSLMVSASIGDIATAQASASAAKNYLNILTSFSNTRLAAVDKVEADLRAFSAQLTDQSVGLAVYGETFSELLNQDNTQEIRDQIDDKNDRIRKLNDEIAKKKRDVGLTAIGGGLSLLIGGSILGGQIGALHDEIRVLKREIDELEGDLAHAIGVYQSYQNSTISISEIETKINEVIPHIDEMKLHWQTMGSKFNVISEALDLAAEGCALDTWENMELINTLIFIQIADENWVDISDLAKQFAQNAYVTIEQ